VQLVLLLGNPVDIVNRGFRDGEINVGCGVHNYLNLHLKYLKLGLTACGLNDT